MEGKKHLIREKGKETCFITTFNSGAIIEFGKAKVYYVPGNYRIVHFEEKHRALEFLTMFPAFKGMGFTVRKLASDIIAEHVRDWLVTYHEGTVS